MYLLLNITAMLIFGSIGLFVRMIPINSALLALIRTVIGAAVLGVIMVFKKCSCRVINKQWNYILLSAIFLGCNWMFLFESYRHTSISNATIIYYTAPIFVLLFSVILFHQRLTSRIVISCCITMLGLVCLLFQSLAFDIQGFLFAFLAALSYAGIVCVNRYIDMEGIPFTFLQLSLAAVIVGIYAICSQSISEIGHIQPSLYPCLLVLGVVHTGLAYALYFTSIAYIDTASVAIRSYLDPCTAVILSIFLLHEPSHPMQLFGIVMIFIGLILSQKSQNKKC